MSDKYLDEEFNLPEDTDPDEVLRKLLGVKEDATEEVSEGGESED